MKTTNMSGLDSTDQARSNSRKNRPSKSLLPRIHFTAPYLINPTNPITVRLIGAGGTGSHMLTALARLHQALLALNHPGLFVYLWDDDTVSEANMARQLFAPGEVGLFKAVALINRVNRFLGTNWKAVPERFTHQPDQPFSGPGVNLTITCVDTLDARRQVAAYFDDLSRSTHLPYTQTMNGPERCYYWLDSGNAQRTGQVILATVGIVQQRKTKVFKPVGELPGLTKAYAGQLTDVQEDSGPSCSIAEALTRQDLYINSTLANMACSILWTMLREAQTSYRGFFLNLGGFKSQPIPV